MDMEVMITVYCFMLSLHLRAVSEKAWLPLLNKLPANSFYVSAMCVSYEEEE